ncbi:N-acetyltransferase [Pradoshia eiseniae]|uniref:N-acetyltransferase n=1 Tax=Pradoshia eiseniae TaxID=2064768 RepID=A0A2S7MWY5_9BACI|nr:GNAT family N-acetyltransferase [Pradoshia eiseniae]PQD94283.1 N-acetyltransferase [Pradoshia eiseniae]
MNKHLENKVQLMPADEKDLPLFKKELQESFTKGLIENLGDAEEGPIPSDEDIEQSFNAPGAVIYHISLNGEKVGGVVLRIDTETHRNSVDLLFISSKSHSRGVGTLAWKAIEEYYPDTEVWELVTPYFEKRNIHFYVNKCGFHIVEFYNQFNPDPHQSSENKHQDNISSLEEYEFFRFEKVMKK